MHPRYLLPTIALLLPFGIAAQQADEAPPEWVRSHNQFLTQGSGCWQTSNAEHQSANEPFDTYFNEWQAGIGGITHLTGRLYGKTGDQLSPDFWDFVAYWDANRGKLITLQFGRNGMVGDGSMWQTGENKFVQEQVFSAPDGRTWKSRHDIEERGDTLITTSSDWVEGEWQQRRSYTWHRCGQK